MDTRANERVSNERKGFDVIVGNPPWDKVRPNKNEFFENLVPGYKKKPAGEKKDIRDQYGDEFKSYEKNLVEKRAFYKKRGGRGENTDFDLYRIVLDRVVEILAPNGVLSMVMPSAITNSRGAAELRKYFLTKNILSLFIFENKERIFDIHAQTRFALLTVQNADSKETFPAAFYLHKLDKLSDLGDGMIQLSVQEIKTMSPQMSIIHEVRTVKDYDLLKKLLSSHPRLQDIESWSVDLGRELNMGEEKDKKLVVKKGGWPVLESKNFHQHIHNYSEPHYRADIQKTLKRTESISKFHNRSSQIHKNPRLAYRAISSSTNTRTMIASIIPPSTFTTINAYMAIPRMGIFDINSTYHELNAYMCGIFNSTVYDYILRAKVDKHVETYMIYDTAMPENFSSDIGKEISKLSAVIALSETWHDGLADALLLSKDDLITNLGARIETVSKIDALCALQFGLTRIEYEHILSTFKSDAQSFSQDELSSSVDYQNLSDAARNKHMRIFYGEVYRQALCHFDQYSQNDASKNQILEVGDS